MAFPRFASSLWSALRARFRQRTFEGSPRRVLARRRRRLRAALALAAPGLWVLGLDVVHRGARLVRFPKLYPLAYWGSFLVSSLAWAAVLFASSRRRGSLRFVATPLFVVAFALSLGVQGGFFSVFNTYLTHDAEVFSRSFFWSLLGTPPVSRPVVWFYLVATSIAAVAMVRNARAIVRPRRFPTVVSAALVVGAVIVMGVLPASYRGVQASTPDLLYFDAMIGSTRARLSTGDAMLRWRPQRRWPETVPALTAKPARPRNVVLILQESQRADVTCMDYDPRCKLPTRASNKAVPGRMALTQMRANDSSTSISCSTIWTGLSPADTEKNLRGAPTLWRYAKAAGYHTSYLTSQHIIFHNMRHQMQDEPLDQFACATTVDPVADFDTGALDAKLSDYAIARWSELPEPFFAVVQYSNQHHPYVSDPAQSPFVGDPKQDKKSHRNLFAHYQNVVYLSDLAVGRLLEHIRKAPSGERTVIVYTADHGEAFGAEHRIGGHTHSIFENEIRVPGWIDAPLGTLAPEEEASIRGARTTPIFHLDLAPTFLDLLGVWDDPALAPFRARMPGHPLTRPERTTGPVLLNNCAWIWEAQTPNWGAMDGTKKLIGRPDWGGAYHCHDVASDPGETKNLGEAACGSLGALARSVFPPFDTKRPVHPLK